jgi:hypothetical protein
MADPDSPLGLCIRYRDAFFARVPERRLLARARGGMLDQPA